MDADQCCSLRDAYVPSHGIDGNDRDTVVVDTKASEWDYVWPSSLTLAPCWTLSCARCAITGGAILKAPDTVTRAA